MLFALICTDKPGMLQIRLDTRPEHLVHLNALSANGTLKLAGPFLDDDGKPKGSLLVVEASDKEAARAIAQSDPYAKAGIFAKVEVEAWNWVINRPEGL